jgi:hypothetical protein
MWHDEAALVLNVLNKSLVELLGPLGFHEAAPPLFLWIERWVTLLLGDSTYALRLIPFLASCVSLILLAAVARRAVSRSAVPWAVLLVACSDHLLWHGCEAKPYAVDALAATAVLAFYYCTRTWPLGVRLALLTGISPCLIFLTYPGCFLCGGLLIVFLLQARQARRISFGIAYGALVAVVFAAFMLLVLGPARAQRSQEMLSCWVNTWPRWDRPWSVPFWTVIQSLEVFRYVFEPAGQTLGLLATVGVACFWRRGAREALMVLAVPILLVVAAAYLHAYPYGGYRVVVFVAPALALLTAEGAAAALAWLAKKPQPLESSSAFSGAVSGQLPVVRMARRWAVDLYRIGIAGLVVLLLLPLAQALHRAWTPWPRPDSARVAKFILAHRRPEDPVVGNHWEYVYYFRGVRPRFRLLPEAVGVPGTRLWMATTAGDRNDRLALAAHFPGDWHIDRQCDFFQSTVFLLSRSEAGVAGAGLH